MRITLNKRRNRALTVLGALILILLLLVFIGTLAWVLWKAIQRITKPSPPDEAAFIQKVVADEVAALQAQHPGETITVQAVSASYVYAPAFVPFEPVDESITIERSTNLTHWEIVGVLSPGETFVDTNPPPAQGFYRSYTRTR